MDFDLKIVNIEHQLHNSISKTSWIPTEVLEWLTSFIVFLLNGSIVHLILKQHSKTFLDSLMVCDCCLGFGFGIIALISLG